MRHLVLAAAALVAAAAPAHAEWMQATSRHFVVYADASPDVLRRQATELELLDAALRRFQKLEDPPESRLNKVTVFVLPSQSAVEKLVGQEGVAGFYLPRVSGSVAFTPRRGDGSGADALSPRIVLFHEYAHHFLLGNFPVAFPAWYSEGYAEVIGTTQITEAAVTIGAAANHRAYGLVMGRGLSAPSLFAPPDKLTDVQREAIYGRGWALAHLILFDPARQNQLRAYIKALNEGRPSLEAAKATFGDLKKLDRDLDDLIAKPLLALTMKREAFPSPTVELRPLTPGERALIELRIQSTRGVNRAQAAAVFARAKRAAAPHGTDAVAQGWLAEMAYDAGDDDAAEAAADAALAADPRSIQALLYKANVRLRRARKGAAPDRWKEARSWIVRANRVDQDDPATLWLYYDSFAAAGETPSKAAVAGLYRAVDLVPQDKGLRFTAARQLLVDGDVPGARAMLRPLAADPHAGADNPAKRLLVALDGGQTGRAALDALEAAAKGAESAD